MAIDLGDVWPLSVFVTDVDGNAVNAGAVVLTITLPDGTTTAPTVTNPVTGTYTASYVTVQTGRHEVFWSATGANACDFEDAFFVQPQHQLIISLAQARSSLRIPAGQTVDDEDLRELIAAATVIMEDLCGPIVSRACDETHDGGYLTVRLLQAPAISVTSVKESYGAGYTRTLTAQPLDGATFDAFGYTVDLTDGILTRRMSGIAGPFMNGRRNIHVTYTAGRSIVRPNLIRATRRLVRFLWQQEMQGQRPNGQAPESMATSTTPSGYLVPNAIKAWCADDLRTVGQG
jgi:hypothetical protein